MMIRLLFHRTPVFLQQPNLSPQVLRELKRHLPNPSSSHAAGGGKRAGPRPAASSSSSSSFTFALAGCLLLTATAGSFPLIAQWWIVQRKGGLNAKEGPLTAAQVRRGAFLNSGTRDVGRDEDWDFKRGIHKEKQQSGYHDTSKELPGHYHAVSPERMADFADKLEAFAKGRGRNN